MNQKAEYPRTETSSQLAWTLGKSVGALTLILLVLQVAVSTNFIFELRKMYRQIKNITEITFPLRKNIREVALKQYRDLNSLKNLSSSLQKQSKDKEKIAELTRSTTQDHDNILDFSQLSKVPHLTTQLNMPIETRKSQELLQDLNQESYDIEKQGQKLIQSLMSDDFKSAEQIIARTQEEIEESFIPTQELIQIIEKITDQELRLIRKSGISSLRVSFFVLIIALFLGISLSIFITHQMLSRLRWNIQQREKAEKKLVDITEELKRSNQELEQFAYVTSHDLQTPLSVILGYLSLLDQKKDASIPPLYQDYLSKIQMAASRMSRFIKDLLEYSRVSSEKKPKEKINLNTLLSHLLKDFEFKIKDSGARIHIHDIPEIEGDPLQIRQLFQNLISNALKFSKLGTPPEISIFSIRLRPGWLQIQVKDNGIGFDENESKAIFEPFKRLHSHDAYEGSGIGLALCRKIVLNHDGEIFARGKPGQGSSFYFTLPCPLYPSSQEKQRIQHDGFEGKDPRESHL